MSDRSGRHRAVLLVVGAAILISGLGLRDPWPADEPRFALVAKDMVRSGNWLIPEVAGVPYPDKPPVFFWLIAACYTLTGSIRFAFLMPAFFAGMGVLLLVIDLARRLWNERVALYVGWTLLVLVQFPVQMKTAQIDAVLCFWTTLGLYGLCRHLLLGPSWRWYAVAGLACGVGVITKGVGFLPLLLLLPYAFAALRGWPGARSGLRDARWLLAPAAMLVPVALWLVPMLAAAAGGDPALAAYRDNILFRQTVTRYADSWGHVKPPWYLLTNAASYLWMPVTALLPWLVPAWRRDLKERDTTTLLLGTWVLLVLVFFSMTTGKRGLYIFPAVPALALITGRHAERLLRAAGPRRVLSAFSLFLSILLLAGGAYLTRRPDELAEFVADPSVQRRLAWSIAALGAVLLAMVAATRVRRAPLGAVLVTASLWILVPPLVFPAIDAARSGRIIVDRVDEVLPEGTTLGFLGWKEQLVYQWDRPAVHFGYRREDDTGETRDAARWVAQDPRNRVLLWEGMAEPCFDKERLVSVGHAHRRDWALADRDALTPECRALDGPFGEIVSYRLPASSR